MEVTVKSVGLKEYNNFEVKIKVDCAEIREELNRVDVIKLACELLNGVTPYSDDEARILPDVIKDNFPHAYEALVNEALNDK